MAPTVTAVTVIISNEALSISPCVFIIEVSFVLKGMSRIVNLDNWIWNYIIQIRPFKNWWLCNTQ